MIKKNFRGDASAPSSKLEYLPQEPKPSFLEKLARNAALAGMLLIAVTALRSEQLPSGRSVLTAVQEMLEPPPWDETLGRIEFVSNLFPETVSVFFDSPAAYSLRAPSAGALCHAWSEDEPYLGYQPGADGRVYALADGQVMSLSYGPDGEKVLRIRHRDGLETLYYNLESVETAEGDAVAQGTCIGWLMESKEAAVEVRREGRSVDPTAWIQPLPEAAP